MKIDILCVGKVRESFYRDAINEYMKRLRRYCTPTIIEVADEKTPDNATEVETNIILEREAERLMKHINDKSSMSKNDTYIITLEIKGKSLSSKGLAQKIESLGINGISRLIFIIGGSLGLHNSICSLADYHLSFSEMTFPHQLMRVILLEQIYRSLRIINNEPYHK